ncbi:MAG: ABC transporter permease [Oscillospiraceae bacterium]|nr:ABC transporter permease [Oscillospiraceae bacterium]
MLLIENILLALNGLRANKMRAFLTMLGIIIGIGSVIGIVNVGESMTNGISTSMRTMGVNNITLTLTQKSDDNTSGGNFFMFGRSSPDESDLMTDEMLNEFRSLHNDYISYIYTTESVGSSTAEYNLNESNVSVTAVSREYVAASNLEMLTGRFISDHDEEKEKNVCVVSSVLCGELMPMQDPIGEQLDMVINNTVQTFYIVGVYDGESSSASSMTQMYIPASTARKLSGSGNGYQSATVVPANGTDTTAFMNLADEYFSQVYSRNKSYTVTASSMESMVESMTEMLSTVSLAIAVIAGISLVVGGIGVMNIMLVSITERTREIGTRKALGATNGSIRLQFITEAIVICMLGGLIGIGLGLVIGNIGAGLLGYSATVSVSTVLIAVGFSMVIGVFFGYYPANKAAKLDPIEALRYE